MDAKEFWCRSYLAAMHGTYTEHADGGRWGNHETPAVYCEAAADAALEVARRRGMVTGERTASAPEIERLKFTAERDGDICTIHSSGLIHGVRYPIGPIDVLCVKWAETMPPKPIEVWIERPAKGGA